MTRRYSLRIDGENFAPADFNEIGAYNPNNLNKDARLVARYVAASLGVEVEVVKHLATGDRVEGYYNEWNLPLGV